MNTKDAYKAKLKLKPLHDITLLLEKRWYILWALGEYFLATLCKKLSLNVLH